MDLRFTPEQYAFREEVRTFVAEHWPLRGADADEPLADAANEEEDSDAPERASV